MAIYMPPIARKKRVPGHYHPDSFRVISTHAEDTHPTFEAKEEKPVLDTGPKFEHGGIVLPDIYNRQTQVLPKSVPDYRANRPHPGGCGFLRYNVRLLNEPICSVHTEATHKEQDLWWPSRTSKEPLNLPPKTKDTIYRVDYYNTDDNSRTHSGSTRHSANPNKEPALGTVPVNFLRSRDGDQTFYKENISYEHQYDCRVDQNYPRRGKRQGSFVWKQMSPEDTRSFIDRQTSEINSESIPSDPISVNGGNAGEIKNGSPMKSSPENGNKSVSFVDEQKCGVDVKASPSDTKININTSDNTGDAQNVNTNNEKMENVKQSDEVPSSKPNSKNGNRNGTIKIHNAVQPELMESLGLSDQTIPT